MYYVATFHPQVWINNRACEVDPLGPTQWDASAFLDAISDQEREGYLKPDTHQSDRLRDDPAAPQWIREWSGPFYVSVEEVEALPPHLRPAKEPEGSLSYEIVLRIDLNAMDASLSAAQHARAVAAYLNNVVGRVLSIRHLSDSANANTTVDPNQGSGGATPNVKAWARQWQRGHGRCPMCAGDDVAICDTDSDGSSRTETWQCEQPGCPARWKVRLEETSVAVLTDDSEVDHQWIEFDDIASEGEKPKERLQ